MRAFAARWLSGDERTLGALLVLGVLIMAFFRLDRVRQILGVAPAPELVLVLLVVMTALAWWSMLSRGFVWLEPAVLTWRDFGDVHRERLVRGRLALGWLGRMVALGYLFALLGAVVGLPVDWLRAGFAVLLAAGLLALVTLRRARTHPHVESAVVLVVAAVVATVLVAARPGPWALVGLAALLVVVAVVPVVRPGRPVSHAGRVELVGGWRDRVLRTVGIQFLDIAMLLPAARPVRHWPLRRPAGLRLAWVGIAARARHLPTAALLALTAIATHLAFPALLDEAVFWLFGYLALVPLAGGLGELWRSPGRRRWVGLGNPTLRAAHVLVLGAVALAWAVPVIALAELAGHSWSHTVALLVPAAAAGAVRTVTGHPPSYDNLAPVDTPMGSMPVRLIAQTLRGPDLGVLVVVLVPLLPVWAAALLVVGVVALAVLR